MKFKFASTVAAILFLSISVVRADSFFVTNPGINTITKYDDNGTGTLFTNSYLNGPTGIALDASGNVYVSTKSNTIEKFAPDGSSLGVFASSGLNNPNGLVFDRGGNLYVANFDGNTVEKFGPDGGNLGTFANVIQPTGLAFDSAGNLCVASFANMVQRFGPGGTPLVPFTSAALSQPQGLAFDSAGALYVASSASNIVEKFSPDGVDLGVAPQVFGAPTTVKGGAQAVHIAYRTDGVAGDGSLPNPFDGSNQAKLDAIFKSYYDAGATDITFHIGPGTFQMKGAWDYDWAMLTGWHIKGSGRSLTIIQQVVGAAGANPGSNGALFSNGPALTYDNQSVEDLTCDCAWFRSGPGGDNSRPHGNFQGINLYGANPTIRNVSVTGCGWQDNECFAILTSGGVNDRNLPDNALYENVEVSNGATGVYATHLTGMAMINLAAMGSDPTPVYAKNGRIINCTFNLPTAGNAGGPPGGYDGGVITGCTFIGDWHGIYFDTFVSKNIIIVGNTIKALYPDSVGILFNPGTTITPLENITIVGNTVYAAGGIGFASGVKNSSILGNRIHLGPTNNPDGSVVFLTSTVQNILVSQNSIDAGIPFFSEETSGCTFSANRTPAGTVAIPDTTTEADSALVSKFGLIGSFQGAGLGAPIGLAFDSSDKLHVVNSFHSTVETSSVDSTSVAVATTGSGPAFIAVQRAPGMVNLSTRLNVLTGENVVASGFIVVGNGTKKVLIRGLGPSLAASGVKGVLADPVIELHDGSTLVASNNNWKDTQASEIQASGLAPTNSAEAVMIANLSAGAYTIIERGQGDSTGVGLIEIYDLSGGAGPELANMSTRGFVDNGSNVMIAGFIAASSTGGSGQMMVRALGPSLGAAGVAQPLADPALELYDSNGVLVAQNDNWKSSQQTEIETTGIAPTNDAEAAILTTLASGAYTAVVRGQGDGGGVGLVETYNLH